MADSTDRPQLPSAKFRSSYAHLSVPTEVVVYDRLVGTWYPAGTEPSPTASSNGEGPKLLAVFSLDGSGPQNPIAGMLDYVTHVEEVMHAAQARRREEET